MWTFSKTLTRFMPWSYPDQRFNGLVVRPPFNPYFTYLKVVLNVGYFSFLFSPFHTQAMQR